jgi:hypothetical protein
MIVRQYEVGSFEIFCYLVGDEKLGEGLSSIMREMTSNHHLQVDFSGALGNNSAVTQNVLLVRFMSANKIRANSCRKDAERPENTTSFVHRYPPDSLWGNGSASAFLQHTRSSSLIAALRENSSAQYRLPSFRSHPLPSLRDHGRLETNQQNRDPSIQRNLSFVVRTSSIPRPIHITSFPQAASSQVYPSTGCFARSASREIILASQPSFLTDFRSGFCHPGPLWQIPMGSCRLQSQEAWPTVLSPPPLLRSPSSRVLAWIAAPWRCGYQYGSCSVSESVSGQGAPIHCPIAYSDSSRFGILWQKGRRISRFYWLWLRDCGQGIFHDQISIQRMSFQKASRWMGSGRISIQTPSLEKTASICGGATAYSRRSRRGSTTHAFQRSQICLPCLGHQFKDSSLEGLAILCQESYHRKEHPGTSLRLSVGQDSHRRLGGQRCFLSDAPPGIQYRSLVQEVMFTERISLHHTGHYSDGLSRPACQGHEKREQKPADTPQRLSLPGAVRDCSQNNRQTQDPKKFMNLQTDSFSQSSIYKGFQTKNNIFTHY